MWNNFSLIAVLVSVQSGGGARWKTLVQSIWQNVNYRRFAIALLLSVLLHLLLVGQFFVNFTMPQAERSVIEARLVLSPVASVPPALTKKAPKPVLAAPVAKEILPVAMTAESETITSEVAASETTPSEAVVTRNTQPQLSDAVPIGRTTSPSASDVERSSDAEETGSSINPQAYRYVETDFDVRTEITENVNASAAGKAKIVYQLLPNNTQYQLKSLIQAKGLASFLIPDLLQTSEGTLGRTGLQPEHYLYQFGDKANKTFSANFDWRNQQLSLHSANGRQLFELPSGTQDLLSFMYQFMFVAPMQNMRLSITNGKKIGTYDYSFEGEVAIDTKMGKFNTLHLSRMAAEGEKKTELWLALDYQYVPVKIRETEKQGKVYELLVTSLKTEMPVEAKLISP